MSERVPLAPQSSVSSKSLPGKKMVILGGKQLQVCAGTALLFCWAPRVFGMRRGMPVLLEKVPLALCAASVYRPL